MINKYFETFFIEWVWDQARLYSAKVTHDSSNDFTRRFAITLKLLFTLYFHWIVFAIKGYYLKKKQFWKTHSESDDFRRAAHQVTHSNLIICWKLNDWTVESTIRICVDTQYFMETQFNRFAFQQKICESIEQGGWALDIKAPVLNNSRLLCSNNSDLR